MATATVAPITPERQVMTYTAKTISCHPLMLALSKASAASALLRGIESGNITLEGAETTDWVRGIALDTVESALKEAAEAFRGMTVGTLAVA